MSHIMTDLETLGLTPGSVIRSIGAVVFDPISGALGETFYRNITRESCEAAGLTVNPETEAWWADQSPEARARLETDQVSLVQALGEFTLWWTTQGGEFFWANDPNFDETHLVAAFAAVGLKHPWSHRAPRSCRTIYDLAGVAPNRDAGVHHDALVDSKNQAIAVHDAYVKLGLATRPDCYKKPEPVWQWYAGGDGESYPVGPEDSREAIIEAGRENYGEDAFYIIEAAKGSMEQYLPSAGDIIEQMCERADDNGAFGEDYCEITTDTKEVEAKLDAVLKGWFDRHSIIFPTPWAFDSTRNAETIPAIVAEAETAAEMEAGVFALIEEKTGLTRGDVEALKSGVAQ